MKIDADRLRGFLDCMHDEADEREKKTAQIAAIVKAAKEAGYDSKAVRKVFVRERMDEAERSKQDDLLETYEGALGAKGRALAAIEKGAPVGEAAKANGIHRATVARARHVAKQPSNATPPHDPETGEISREMTEDDLGKPEKSCAPDSTPADPLTCTRDPIPLDSVGAAAESLVAHSTGPSPPPQPEHPKPVAAIVQPPPVEDDLEIPPYLRRELVRA